MVEDREVLREVWSGRIPACFTLGSSDALSSAGSVAVASEPADPFYIMLPRQSYLTLVTDKVRKHFNKLLSTSEDDEIWFSDGGCDDEQAEESSSLPLKWHLPVGVLFDQRAIRSSCSPTEDDANLPWKINVHFGNFPHTQLIRFNSRELMESHFMSCIKEADQIKHGGRVASSMQKKDHIQLWQGLQNDKFDQFWAVNRRLMDNKSSTASGAAAAISASSAAGTGSGESSETVIPSVFKHIPVRLYLCDSDASSPPMHQRLVKPMVKTETSGEKHQIEETELTGQIRQATLKDLVADMVPNRPLHEVKVITQGISPEWDTPLQWMSEHLSYPDNFLHICVR